MTNQLLKVIDLHRKKTLGGQKEQFPCPAAAFDPGSCRSAVSPSLTLREKMPWKEAHSPGIIGYLRGLGGTLHPFSSVFSPELCFCAAQIEPLVGQYWRPAAVSCTAKMQAGIATGQCGESMGSTSKVSSRLTASTRRPTSQCHIDSGQKTSR